MKNRYLIKFSKHGFVRYTSHLDMLRLFKRAFKKNDIQLVHSQGFNPHPKLGFAQPLSLGYTADGELLEFETVKPYDCDEMKEKLQKSMPEGVDILYCGPLDLEAKSIASVITEAVYTIKLPEGSVDEAQLQSKLQAYMEQPEIIAMKKKKKPKELAPQNIKGKIRELSAGEEEDCPVIVAKVDSGSGSNLSPELIIQTFLPFAGLEIPRSDVEVRRDSMNFEL